MPEVALYFQNRLFRANRTSKRSAEALSAFRSYNYPPLAEVGVNICYNTDDILRPSCDGSEPLRISERMDENVVIVKLFPGISERTLRAVLAVEGLKGVVLETFGTGNAPTEPWFIDTLADAIRRGITIINVTQCQGGAVVMELYETGLRLQNIGVVCGHDMTTEAAVTKLMWLLGKNLSEESLSAALAEPMRGEFTA